MRAAVCGLILLGSAVSAQHGAPSHSITSASPTTSASSSPVSSSSKVSLLTSGASGTGKSSNATSSRPLYSNSTTNSYGGAAQSSPSTTPVVLDPTTTPVNGGSNPSSTPNGETTQPAVAPATPVNGGSSTTLQRGITLQAHQRPPARPQTVIVAQACPLEVRPLTQQRHLPHQQMGAVARPQARAMQSLAPLPPQPRQPTAPATLAVRLRTVVAARRLLPLTLLRMVAAAPTQLLKPPPLVLFRQALQLLILMAKMARPLPLIMP
ncbi:hypothetical protein BAUCODRAFT_338089 [Baudoinia panamericana UAMH 10762]|uniref:REJ domain-containing protein n=1 Tax=Baudoinia panamericana (strain UAMH 10762) TaxID=717646 RepID=M2N636_BAUPA|nr:uncharacterized protein BAUCODRAFT_338089 [Baudoinia panamericana UAMH 10762]EMC99488.1 hypothetical protein BAUCODRAFT_338089 [Baudoinia panamericana UAMH 10762]